MVRFPPSHPLIVAGNSVYQKRMRSIPDYKGSLLKLFADNGKLGNGKSIIRKGKWKGLTGYYLTLEERATCPKTCHHWDNCYGNNMPFAIRFHPGKELEIRLWNELAELNKKHRIGFVVRLHVLGDFYSVEYVDLWRKALERFPKMRVFGYTARNGEDPISLAIQYARSKFPERFKIRQSMQAHLPGSYSAISVPHDSSIVCPVQLGKQSSCANCSLCWEVDRPIQFLTH
jgi:hypothetical protein